MSTLLSSTVFLLLTSAISADAPATPQTGSQPAPFFSDAEREAIPETAPFDFRLADKDGIRVPRVNGRGLMGINAQFSNADPRQAHYEAPILGQQGVNNVKLGLRPEGWGFKEWIPVQQAFQQAGISTIWSAYAMSYEDQYFTRLLELPEGTLTDTDRAIMEDGQRNCFRGMGTLGNIFSSEFRESCRKVIDHTRGYFDRYPAAIGYQYTNEVQFKTGSYDPEARKSWQDFLRSLFKDTTPAADTNGDGACFNRTFATSYESWDEVNQFRGEDWKDPRRALLRDAWIGLNYARYLDDLAQRTRKGHPNLLAGAMICVPLSPTVDLSLMLSMPNVNASFINTYFCWLGNGLLCESIADTYRKPSIASEIGMPNGKYEDVKWGALTHLPYLEGYQWFTYSMLPKEAGGEHGGKYGLVDRWTINALEDRSDRFTEPYKVVDYNSRFAIIPQLAPFVGRLHAGHDRRILWISAGGYPRDWQEDHAESCIMRANVSSDVALALAPQPLDLGGYKVIIYRNLQSPCISKDIYRRLRDFVAAGGTVITGAYFIGAEGTWLGEDNKGDWWQGLRLVRDEHSDTGTTQIRYAGHEIETKGTFQYLVAEEPEVQGSGEVADSSGASRPFLLTRREGKGRWVYINVPYFFQITEPYEGFSPEKYQKRFDCLRQVVFDYSGQMPADRYGTQWYAGDDCVLAIREKSPGPQAETHTAPSGVEWPNGKYVMFDTFGLKIENGSPYVEVSENRLAAPKDLEAAEAKLWVVKPYGRPIVLYADGTLKNQAKIDSGVYSDGRLTFGFAERVFISSPSRPSSVKVGGGDYPYRYDDRAKLLTIERTGASVEAVVTYGDSPEAARSSEPATQPTHPYTLNYDSQVNPPLQAALERIDASLRERFGMTGEQAAVGVLDLTNRRLAMIHPDRIEYAASVPKIGILLAYFQLHPEAATHLDPVTQHELGLMAKASNNEMASKFSHQLGLKAIQRVLDEQHFYDKDHGGGIWVGKHYGRDGERYTDPVGGHSHAATVRQLLRFFLLLEQGELVSPGASRKMREIFASPEIPHDNIKFVKGLADRDVRIIRKWGTWEDWHHDAAVVTGPNRHYILVALTNHPKGDDYLVDLAQAVDDLMRQSGGKANR